VSHHLVFGVDRLPDPWPPTWENGSLFSTEDLRTLDEAEQFAEEAVRNMMPDRDLSLDPILLSGRDGVVVSVRVKGGWHRRQGLPPGALDGIDEGSL
jgi:hypothetical protein